MIQKMSHATIYVLDQDVAKDFYVGKLGFEVKVDSSLPNGFRWLTVTPKGQPDLEIGEFLTNPTAIRFGRTNTRFDLILVVGAHDCVGEICRSVAV